MMFAITRAHAPGEFTTDAVSSWVSQLCDKMTSAGAVVFEDSGTSDSFRTYRAGRSGLSVSPIHPIDDSPCWQIYFQEGYPSVTACACPKTNPSDLNDPSGYDNLVLPDDVKPISLWAAGDPVQGWWWALSADMTTPTAPVILNLFCLVNSRRYPADMNAGIAARFGALYWNAGSSAFKLEMGYRITAAATSQAPASYTIEGPAGKLPLTRHTASPLPRCISPIYPTPLAGQPAYSAAIMGELDSVMLATDGYAWAEQAQPGWKVFGSATQGHLALRAPDGFTPI